MRAKCPICILPGPLWGVFEADTDDELFAKIAEHTISMHNGGSGDAYWAASVALSLTAARYQREMRT